MTKSTELKELSKIDILIEQARQVKEWAEDNKDSSIEDLEDCEVFWENAIGIEISEYVDGIKLYDALCNCINELYCFIRKNTNQKKCYPDGIPIMFDHKSIWHDIDPVDESTWPKIEDKEIISEFDCASIDVGRVTAQCNGFPPLISYFLSQESTSKNLKRWARLGLSESTCFYMSN